ncbi:MAG: AraC family transcriptional regulator [Bacteroidales bacterium]|nr:AraC family transcriptional regulator [Bacteroidales bacterium]
MASTTTLHIKNMVCNRCKMVVEQLTARLGLPLESLDLGEAVFAQSLTPEQLSTVRKELEAAGFEIISDRRSRMVDGIRTAVLEYIASPKTMANFKLSEYISSQLNCNYATLSNTFSADRGITIERYCILQKIERVKELLIYDELSIAEIAYQLNYSSTAHLSAQFRSVTGMSPRQFKQMGGRRIPLDQV